MANKFQTRRIKVVDLQLDPQNPRFVALKKRDQSSIIAYLLENEDVIDLARSINSYGGLMPGEFPIVCIENNISIVIEGNRRVCACKILLDPGLAPAEFRASIPKITPPIRNDIKKIQVHIISSREAAQIVLGTRHIQGIKKWPSVSKFMFFANQFKAGKSLDEIKTLTGVRKETIVTALKKHFFLEYILSLDCWTELERQNHINYASLHEEGVDRILRIFNTAGSKDLKLKYDDHYKPSSELPDFGKIVEHVVRRVLGILPGKFQISTRTTFSDIRGEIKEWLPPTSATPSLEQTGGVAKSKSSRQTEFYLENLVYNVSPSTKENRALIAICEEVKRISKGGAYRQYPLASSYLVSPEKPWRN